MPTIKHTRHNTIKPIAQMRYCNLVLIDATDLCNVFVWLASKNTERYTVNFEQLGFTRDSIRWLRGMHQY